MIASFPGEAYSYFVSNGEDYSRLPSDDVDGDSQEVTNGWMISCMIDDMEGLLHISLWT